MKKYIIIAILGLASLQLSAQEEDDNMFWGSWEMGYSTSGYLKDYSFAGGRLEWRHMIKPRLSVGLAMTWNTYEEYAKAQTYTTKDGLRSVHSDMLKTVYNLPLTLNMHYYFASDERMVIPFLGINAGAQYSEQNAYINIFQIYDENWGFTLRPEAGILLDTEGSVNPFLSVGYNVSTNKNDDFNVASFQHIAINVGMAISLD